MFGITFKVFSSYKQNYQVINKILKKVVCPAVADKTSPHNEWTSWYCLNYINTPTAVETKAYTAQDNFNSHFVPWRNQTAEAAGKFGLHLQYCTRHFGARLAISLTLHTLRATHAMTHATHLVITCNMCKDHTRYM